MRRLKKRNENESSKLKSTKKEEYPDSDFDYPIFCFKYLDKDFHIDKCIEKEVASFAKKIIKLGQEYTWIQIQNSVRHKWGSEKINWSSLKNKKPPTGFSDKDILLALRFEEKKPFLGVRRGSVLHVMFIDHKFSLYSHG